MHCDTHGALASLKGWWLKKSKHFCGFLKPHLTKLRLNGVALPPFHPLAKTLITQNLLQASSGGMLGDQFQCFNIHRPIVTDL